MPALPETASLLPREYRCPQGTIHYFPAEGFPIVRLDLLHEAGSAYQPQPLCAAAAARLFTLASEHYTATQVAEFMDYRGIVVENEPDTYVNRTTFYFHRRYLDDLLPLLDDLLRRPAFPQADFDAYLRRRRQELLTLQQQTSAVARRLFYQTLLPDDHPLARYAEPDDALRLDRDTVARYYDQRFLAPHIVLSGQVDDELLSKVKSMQWNVETGKKKEENCPLPTVNCPLPTVNCPLPTVNCPLPTAVQTTLRIGRIVPLRWDDPDYARLMLLVTALGGYFGSRLMSSLREDLGLTYGIYARTQIYRQLIVFYITADVAGGTADQAEQAIRAELQRLCDQPLDDEELLRVKTVLAGDFLRSVDGVFERAQRYENMWAACTDERLTDNMRAALADTTALQLRDLAQRLLAPESMIYCRAGA